MVVERTIERAEKEEEGRRLFKERVTMLARFISLMTRQLRLKWR